MRSDSQSATGEAATVNILDISTTQGDQAVDLTIKADGPIEYTVFKMSEPMRLIVDMSKVDMSNFQSTIPVDNDPVMTLRPLYFPQSNDSRIEIDLSEDVDYLLNDDEPTRLVISISPKGSRNAESQPGQAQEPTEEKAVAEAPAGVVQGQEGEPGPMDNMTVTDLVSDFAWVENVEFKQFEGMSRVEVTLSRSGVGYELLAREKLNRLTLDLPGALVASGKERLIKVNLDESKVKNVALFQFSGGEKPIAKVVVNLEEMQLYNIKAEGNKILLDIGDEAVLAMSTKVEDQREEELVTTEKDLFAAKYKGARISLDFQKADIHNILRIIADVSGLNVITSDAVKGEITIKLKNVPWDQALEVILKNNGLDKIQEGNIIRVSTAADIQKEKEAAEKLQTTERKIANLYTRIFEINYESATDLKSNLDSIKSERGTIQINKRTNALIIKDTKQKLSEMAHLIAALDKKELQVLIEARIVEVTHNFGRQLGIQWGGAYNTVTNSNFPNTIGVTGGAGGSPNGLDVGGSLVDLPISASPTGAIGLTLGHVNGTALLDMKLSVMENSGNGRIVSMPKITTMNNKEALIESGQEVPYQTTSADGTKTEFKKATLSLKVTPHVTPDSNIRLEIETSKDEPNFDQAIGGVPPIFTKKATTEVMVADGDTTVIGGLFKDTGNKSENRVPLLGKIPILGWLFKNRTTSKTGEELLIFITPKVVE